LAAIKDTGKKANTLDTQRQAEGVEKLFSPIDYPRHLRVIGQDLETLRLKTFNLECTADAYLVALAALAGAVVAARVARLPVVLDGFPALAAAAALHRINGSALDHCILAQQAAGGAFLRLQERLGKESVFDFGISVEDGSAALLVLGLLRGVLAAPP
jgi:hypothetical protein